MPRRPGRPAHQGPRHLSTRPDALLPVRPDGDQRRQDERVQPDQRPDPAVDERGPVRRRPVELLVPGPRRRPELLGVRRPLRAGRPLLHVDVRADVPRAPVHGRRAVVRHRRQQVDRRPRPGNYCDDPTETAPRFPRRPADARRAEIMELERPHHRATPTNVYKISDVLGAASGPASTSRSCPTSSRQAGISLELLRERERWHERVQADRPRPVRADVGQGPGPATRSSTTSRREAARGLLARSRPSRTTSTPARRSAASAPARTGPCSTSTRSCRASTGAPPRSSWSGTTSAGSTTRRSRRTSTSWAWARGRRR